MALSKATSGDNDKVLDEIYRVLKNKGAFIAIDSLNNNPIYRLNRYLHYLKGERSLSTIARMPDLKLLRKYEQKFQ
jgi:ubiquinone/menaquinone biosynthesis C-methylase UbiE